MGPPLLVLNIFAPFRFALRSSRFVFLYAVSALCLVSRLALASCFAYRLASRHCVSLFLLTRGRWHLIWVPLSLARRSLCLVMPCRYSFRFVFLYSVSPCVLPFVPFCVSSRASRPACRSCVSSRASRLASRPCVPLSLLARGGTIRYLIWAPFRPACRSSSCLVVSC